MCHRDITETGHHPQVDIGVIALLATACGSDDNDDHAAQDDAAENEAAWVDDVEEVEEVEEIEVDEAALQAILDEWRTDVDAYGATLSIRVPGHGDIHLASGIDDRDPDTPMPADGTYDVGSVTTTFVAATALHLVDEGRLSLNEPVAAWLPELPNAEEITLAMLLDHTSGLGTWCCRPDASESAYADYQRTLLDDPTRSFTPEELLAKHLEQPPIGPPGQGFANANTDYTALGMLIERHHQPPLRHRCRRPANHVNQVLAALAIAATEGGAGDD